MDRHCLLDLLQLLHHALIDMQTTRSIQNHDIIAVFLSMLHRRFCDVNRAVARAHGKDFHLLFLAVDLQLFNRCRTVNVTGYKQWLFAF